MNTPFIVINGSKGKTSTIKYFSYITNQLYKLNVLTYDYNEKLNVIEKIKINDNINLNIDEIRKEINPIKNNIYHGNQEKVINPLNEEEIFTEISVLLYAFLRYKIDAVVCKTNILIKYFKVLASGLTTIENHESQNIDYSVDLIMNKNPDFIRENTPLITVAHIKPVTFKILDICYNKKTPVILTNFYHLKYLEYDTGIQSRYSYVNVSIALTLAAYVNKSFDFKIKEPLHFKSSLYRESTYGHHKVYVGFFPGTLPVLKNINFDKTYSNIHKHNNIKFYIDNGGSYKSSNLIIDWFNKGNLGSSGNSKNFCIFSSDTNIDLIKTLLPLTTINFETLYIVDYNLKGRDVEELFSAYNFNQLLDEDEDFIPEPYKNIDNSWTETTYNTLNKIYSSDVYDYSRKYSSLILNEYMNFGEMETYIDDHLKKIVLPKTPNLVIDDLQSVLNWIYNVAETNKNISYNVLITGSKILTNEALGYINLL